jgi:hypothetical protein
MSESFNFGFSYEMQARRIKPGLKKLWLSAIDSGNEKDFADEDFLVFDEWEVHNVVPTLAQNYILGASFGTVSPISALYVGLHSTAYTCLISDTFASFLASATEVTNYTTTGSNRLAYTQDTIASGSLTNAVSPTIFTFTGSATVNGGFLTGTQAQNASTGYLISAVRTPSAKSFVVSEQLKVLGGLTLTSV